MNSVDARIFLKVRLGVGKGLATLSVNGGSGRSVRITFRVGLVLLNTYHLFSRTEIEKILIPRI